MAEWSAFEPVLLDLRDSSDYAVLIAAMHDYAAQLEEESVRFEADAATCGYPSDAPHNEHRRDAVARLRRMIDDIDRQLDANTEARKMKRRYLYGGGCFALAVLLITLGFVPWSCAESVPTPVFIAVWLLYAIAIVVLLSATAVTAFKIALRRR